jgi:ankyrin repeat protein
MATAGGNWKDLVKACEEGDESLVKHWLDSGVDPNFQHPEYQHTAMMAAARAGQTAVLKLLVAAGANPHAQSDFDGIETALDFAADAGQKDAIAYLQSLGVLRGNPGSGHASADSWSLSCAVA